MTDSISSPRPSSARGSDVSLAIRDALADQTDAMLDMLETLVRIESPTTDPQAQAEVQAVIGRILRDLGFRTQIARGGVTSDGDAVGDHLVAVPADRKAGQPVQLLLGHGDTVWPHGTLETMPFEIDRAEGVVRGPGVFDMKAGLTQMVFALRALRDLGCAWTDLPVAPVVMVSADEEIGSPTGTRHIERLAACCDRALVVEPALGLDGAIKTERKGSGRFRVHVKGRSAHAGLDPDSGASAILELSHVVQRLHALSDSEAGVSVNVGTIDGGTRPNVVAAESRAVVDVRVTTNAQAEAVEAAIRGIEPAVEGTQLTVEGGIARRPMVKTEMSDALWRFAREAGSRLGLSLTEGRSGGVSDGNTAARFAPTLDGLGPVGDGAHAPHEFCRIDAMPERSALLAMLIAAPPATDLANASVSDALQSLSSLLPS